MATIQEITERGIAAFNRRDVTTLQEIYSSDCAYTAPGEMHFTGATQIIEFLKVWWAAFPDCTGTPTNLLFCGEDYAVEEGLFEGTHDGVFRTPMGDIQPTHRKVHGEYVIVSKVSGGKCMSQHLTFDRLQLMEQLGLVPTPAATA